MATKDDAAKLKGWMWFSVMHYVEVSHGKQSTVTIYAEDMTFFEVVQEVARSLPGHYTDWTWGPYEPRP